MDSLKLFAHKFWKFLRIPKKLQLFIMRRSQDSFLVGVTGVILNDKNEIMFVKHTYREVEWSLPGGYVKAGEHPKEALIREIKEETNLNVSINKRLAIWADKNGARIDLPFMGLLIGGSFKPSAEVSKVKFFSPLELPPVINDQKNLVNQIIKSEDIKINLSKKDKILKIIKIPLRIRR